MRPRLGLKGKVPDKRTESNEPNELQISSKHRSLVLKQQQQEDRVPHAIEDRSVLTRRPFRLVGDFPMVSTVRLVFGEDLGGGEITIQADTSLTLAFIPSGIRDTFYIQLKDAHLLFRPFDIPVSPSKTFRVQRFEVGPEQFDLRAFEGIVNSKTKEAALKFVIVLDPADIPVLAKLGLGEAMRLVAEERGHLDILTGAIDTHAAPFNLGPGLFENVVVMGGQLGDGEKTTTTETQSVTIAGSVWAGPVCNWEAFTVTVSPNPGAGKSVDLSFEAATGSISVEFSNSPNPSGGGSSPLTLATDSNGQVRAYYHIKSGNVGDSGTIKATGPGGSGQDTHSVRVIP